MIKLNIGVIIVTAIKKLFKFNLSMCPNKENIINMQKPYQWLRFLSSEKTSIYFIHKNANISRSKFCPNGCVQYYVHNLAIKFKVVVFNDLISLSKF